ncbi:TetR/AcrR family transcriptional regulator [Pseudoalteromonas fenneropenaei]|uniref:TetR/AcrR family transcriptional regulator n=1 Tax=Pseudoalteromonas fenneropenaei TaxID=1737459 RepID=A0ABV7CJT7_9GAMM
MTTQVIENTPASARPASEVSPSHSRTRLLAAAKALFFQHGYSQVTTRAIAAEANVNVALIRYHFLDKAGLFETVLRDTAAPLLEQLKHRKNVPADEAFHSQFILRYYQVMAAHPSLPKLLFSALHDETSQEHEIVKKVFFNHLELGIKTMGASFAQLPSKEGLDPRLLLLSCVCLSVFPFLLPPVMRPLVGLDLDKFDWQDIARHQQAFLNATLKSCQA